MPTTTLLQLKIDLLNEWNQCHSGLARLRMPRVTTSLGTTATLVDSVLSRGSPDANDFKRLEVEIAELVTNGPALGEVSAITDFSGSTLTISPAFTAAVQNGTDYLIYADQLSPEVVAGQINDVLRNTEGPHLWFPSLAQDADFDADDLTLWPAVGTPGTRAFTTTAANALFGERSLHIVAAAAGDGARCTAFPVTEDEQVLVMVLVQAQVADVTVQLYDETNSAVVKAVTVDQRDWTEVYFTEDAPVGCQQMSVRFLAGSATSDFYISAPVLVQSLNSARAYQMPSWLLGLEKVGQALSWSRGFTSEIADSYKAFSEQARAAPRPRFLRSDRGLNPLMVEFKSQAGYPYALEVWRPFSELSSLSATTTCDREYLVWKALANLYFARSDEEHAARYGAVARSQAGVLHYGRRAIGLREPEAVLV